LTALELRGAAAKCTDGAQVRRILALALVLEGRPRTEAAALNGMDRQTLSDWVHRYNADGIEGLKSRKSPGRDPFLTEAQKAELRALVIPGPDPAVHKVVRWRCADLRAEVARRWSIEVHESTIGAWLGELGLTRLQPRPVHPKKDAEAETTFKKTSPASPLNDRHKRRPLLIVQLRWLARSLAVDEPVWTSCIEPQHPIADNL
jgi:transposase